jgi:hypothetical protein
LDHRFSPREFGCVGIAPLRNPIYIPDRRLRPQLPAKRLMTEWPMTKWPPPTRFAASAASGRKAEYITTSVTKMGLGSDNRMIAALQPPLRPFTIVLSY